MGDSSETPAAAGIPDGISRDDILKAVELFDAGAPHQFGPSLYYDLLVNGKRYPPKAIVGLAARRLRGRVLLPTEFSGGEGSKCFRVLKDLGFQIVQKERPPDGSHLPGGVSGGVWIEITKARNKGKAWPWRLGDTVWSPSVNSAGARTYETMRQPKAGDIVIHCVDSVLRGWSVVRDNPRETADEPPHAGEWAGRPSYYIVELRDFTEFRNPEPLSIFLTRNDARIRTMIQSRPEHFPFVLQGNAIITRQGGYLSRVTPELYAIIRDDVNRSADDDEVPAYTLDRAMEELFLPREDFEQMLEGLRRKKNIVLQGPPGVGKSFVARRLAYALLGAVDDSRVETVQFHPSYSYEDFVQGYRPTDDGKFVLKGGVFFNFCRSAADKDYAFIIDEVNRGNLSKILGELMLLIEPDKRGPQFALPLTYSKDRQDRFFVPERVHVIGLMNTADRSLALVDYALRRRFLFFNLQPNFTTAFRDYLVRRGAEPDLATLILKRMTDLNKAISDAKDLGHGFRIGHSFFCPGTDVVPDRAWYDSVVEYEIAPLLSEYWFDDKKQAEHWIDRLLQ